MPSSQPSDPALSRDNVPHGHRTRHNARLGITRVKFTPKFSVHDVNERTFSASHGADMFTTSSTSTTSTKRSRLAPALVPNESPARRPQLPRGRMASRAAGHGAPRVAGTSADPQLPLSSTAGLPFDASLTFAPAIGRLLSFPSYPLTASSSTLRLSSSFTCQRQRSPLLAARLHHWVNLKAVMPNSA